MFCTLIYLGFRNRFRPAMHKRLMPIATLAILEAAVVRWPIFESFAEPVIDALYVVTILLLLIAYDWWSTGRVQSVTLWAGAFVAARYLIGHTELWQAFAAWVQTWAVSFHGSRTNRRALLAAKRSHYAIRFELPFDGCWIVGQPKVAFKPEVLSRLVNERSWN